MNYPLPMIKYTIILQGNIFFHINKGCSNVYTISFGNIIWNALQKKMYVNVSIVKFKSTSKLYFMEHNLKIIFTK